MLLTVSLTLATLASVDGSDTLQTMPVILIIEDGDEYLRGLSSVLAGCELHQARNASEAADLLRLHPVDLIYLDMRFDRIPVDELEGDLASLVQRFNGSYDKGLRYLQNNQGLYVLHRLEELDLLHPPVLVAYDFTLEPGRLRSLQQRYGRLDYVDDCATAAQIRAGVEQMLQG